MITKLIEEKGVEVVKSGLEFLKSTDLQIHCLPDSDHITGCKRKKTRGTVSVCYTREKYELSVDAKLLCDVVHAIVKGVTACIRKLKVKIKKCIHWMWEELLQIVNRFRGTERSGTQGNEKTFRETRV